MVVVQHVRKGNLYLRVHRRTCAVLNCGVLGAILLPVYIYYSTPHLVYTYPFLLFLYTHCVVRDGTLLQRFSLGAVHGKIALGERFGSPEWSPDETTLIYVAEVKYQQGKSFFDVKEQTKDSDLNVRRT